MDRLRILLGGAPSRMLETSIIEQIRLRDKELEYVGTVPVEELQKALTRYRKDGKLVNVVFVKLESTEFPEHCRALLDEFKSLVIVGLTGDETYSTFNIRNPGVENLWAVVRAAARGLQSADRRMLEFQIGTSSKPRAIGNSAAGYDDAMQHLAAEMSWVDDLLRIEIASLSGDASLSSNDDIHGLTLTRPQIEALLSVDSNTSINTMRRDGREGVETKRQEIEERLLVTDQDEVPLAWIMHWLKPTMAEYACLVLLLAPEIDGKYRRVYRYLQNDPLADGATLELLSRLLGHIGFSPASIRQAVDNTSGLRRHLLIRPDSRGDNQSFGMGTVYRVDERFANYVVGIDDLGARLSSCASSEPWSAEDRPNAIDPELVQRLEALVEGRVDLSEDHRKLVVYLWGRAGSGRAWLIQFLSEKVHRGVIRLNVAAALKDPDRFAEVARLAAREALFSGCFLCVESFDALLTREHHDGLAEQLGQAIRAYSPITLIVGVSEWLPGALFREAIYIDAPVPMPDDNRSRQIWRNELDDTGFHFDEQCISKIVGTFRLTPGQIRDATNAARSLALWESPAAPRIRKEHLMRGCRGQLSTNLGKFATRITPTYTWDDIVLPADQMDQLQEICAQFRYSFTVLKHWNFDSKLSYGRGIAALFAGPSGTGKTMAAEVVASELGLPIYKVNLAAIVSKYIGETESNLNRVFDEAQDSNAILFFDEADAIFGRRSIVKDSHDRHANTEVAFLLQKLEEMDSQLAILSSNLKANIDTAFFRRIRFILDFSMPTRQLREQIWRGVFPHESPVCADVDFALLARRLEISGGNIKNIGLRAAFSAAAAGEEITMNHLEQASRRELQKIGRPWQGAEFAA